MSAPTMAPVRFGVHTDAMPCTHNPQMFEIVKPTSIDGRMQILAALSACHHCPALTACHADVATWKRQPQDVVVGGMFYNRRRRPSSRPPTARSRHHEDADLMARHYPEETK